MRGKVVPVLSTLQRLLLTTAYGTPRKPTGVFRADQVRKMLLIRRNGIGDMICTLPLLRNIRAAWPHVQLDVLASESNACVLENLKLVNQVFLYHRGTGLLRNHYFNLPRVVRPVRKENYDLMIAVKGGFSPLLGTVSWATRIPWRLGYVPSRGHSMDFCYNLKVELPVEREHQVESCLRFLEPLGIPRQSCDLSIRLDPPHEEFADAELKSAGVGTRRFALFNISSERGESRWTSVAIAQTAQHLEREFQLPMVVCGLGRDSEVMKETQRLSAGAIRRAVEPRSIHHFAALASRAKFVMCGDGGPMHVAAAVNTPVFVLFSATDPQIWRPYGVPFACMQKGRFVSDMTPTEVVAKIREWLPSLPKLP